MCQGVDIGDRLFSVLGAVTLGVELFAPLDYSVEILDECSVFLLEDDEVSSQALLPLEQLQTLVSFED